MMKITWYIHDSNDNPVFNWESEGELPPVGSSVYFRDWRSAVRSTPRGSSHTKYTVVSACISIGLWECEVSRFASPEDKYLSPENAFVKAQTRCQEQMEGYVFGIDSSCFQYSKTRGEVILKEIKKGS